MQLITSALSVGLLIALASNSSAMVIRGNTAGTNSPVAGFTIGGDLTDPENNGDSEHDAGYNAIFAASEEPTFGGAEAAFNIFDNAVGIGNSKWCCGDQNNFPTNPIWVQATFAQAYKLTRFTITGGNDSHERDPVDWQIQGSNDGVNFTPIFTNTGTNVWAANFNQTNQWDAGTDFPTQTVGYTTFRFNITATGATVGARFQSNELEFFGTPVPEPSTVVLFGLGAVGLLMVKRRK